MRQAFLLGARFAVRLVVVTFGGAALGGASVGASLSGTFLSGTFLSAAFRPAGLRPFSRTRRALPLPEVSR